MIILPVMVETITLNHTYDVRVVGTNQTYFNCVHIGGDHTVSSPFVPGDRAVLFSDNRYHYIMALHNKAYSAKEGVRYIYMGLENAIAFDCDGSIRICKIVKKPDGSITEITRMRYDSDKTFDLQTSEYNWTVPGLSAFTGELDQLLGFYTHKFTTKGRYDDPGIRYKKEVKGTLAGMSSIEIIDVTPSPLGGVPEKLMSTALPLSLTVSHDSSNPLAVILKALAVPIASITYDPDGTITIESGVAGTGATIKIDVLGNITVSNLLSSVKMNAAGQVKISGTTFEASGAVGGLVSTLSQITNLLASHIHPTGTGPSGPPVSQPLIIQKKLILDGIKG